MSIISISLNDQILSEIDAYKKALGFSGRSEIIRAGIRSFISEEKQKSELSGNINSILLVLHDDDFDNVASDLSKDYEDMITTRMHSKIDGKKCMELFVLRGNAKLITEMTAKYTTNRYMDTVKIVAF